MKVIAEFSKPSSAPYNCIDALSFGEVKLVDKAGKDISVVCCAGEVADGAAVLTLVPETAVSGEYTLEVGSFIAEKRLINLLKLRVSGGLGVILSKCMQKCIPFCGANNV